MLWWSGCIGAQVTNLRGHITAVNQVSVQKRTKKAMQRAISKAQQSLRKNLRHKRATRVITKPHLEWAWAIKSHSQSDKRVLTRSLMSFVNCITRLWILATTVWKSLSMINGENSCTLPSALSTRTSLTLIW